MRFNRAQLTDFTNGKIAFPWNGWKLIVITWFQHVFLPDFLVSDRV
jgi:hypothetical protein